MGALSAEFIGVLQADPDLGEGICDEELGLAMRQAVGEVMRLDVGAWTPVAEVGRGATVGLLILDGVLCRRVRMGRGASVELLGAGDVLRPWEDDPHESSTDVVATWSVLQTSRIVKLGPAFERAAIRWPQLSRAIVGRTIRRARRLAATVAISQVGDLDGRLLLLLRHLADRWGHVEPGWTVVALNLPQETLGELVHAQRSSVNRALRRLRERGLVAPRPGGWALRNDAVTTQLTAMDSAEGSLAPVISIMDPADRPFAVTDVTAAAAASD